jgi:hypothetical protein
MDENRASIGVAPNPGKSINDRLSWCTEWLETTLSRRWRESEAVIGRGRGKAKSCRSQRKIHIFRLGGSNAAGSVPGLTTANPHAGPQAEVPAYI